MTEPVVRSERRGPVATLATDLRRGRTPLLAVEPWPGGDADGPVSLLAQGCTVEVELWEAGVDGRLVAPRRGRYAQRLDRDAETTTVDVGGVPVRTLPLMVAPTWW